MGAERYDYVIVGGGSAGCALANRLSADPGTSVLVLEAGRSDYKIDPFIHMPAALPFPIGSRFYDWRYETDPEPELGGRKVNLKLWVKIEPDWRAERRLLEELGYGAKGVGASQP